MQPKWMRSQGQEDPLEKENGNPVQYVCLGNPMNREAWQTAVHRVTKESDMTEYLNDNYLSIYLSIYILLQILFPYRLIQNTEYSSLCYPVGPC